MPTRIFLSMSLMLFSQIALSFTAAPLCGSTSSMSRCAPLMSANKFALTEKEQSSTSFVGVVVSTAPPSSSETSLMTALELLSVKDAEITRLEGEARELDQTIERARAVRETLSSDVALLEAAVTAKATTEAASVVPAAASVGVPVHQLPAPAPAPVANAQPEQRLSRAEKYRMSRRARRLAQRPGKTGPPAASVASTAATLAADDTAATLTADDMAEFDRILAAPARAADWNPKALGVPSLPGPLALFSEQFEPTYLESAPAYLDGTLTGDVGFDPWALTVLANPTMSPDALASLDKVSRSAEERNQRMLSLSAEEQQAKLLWMRSSELKHGRLAMLACAGWVFAENFAGGSLKLATNGRAPSLFNGHLLDYTPALALFLGGLTLFEVRTKDTVKDGDYGFDPLGFADGYGAMGTLKTAEIKHGRAAMMAITGFAVQELVWGSPVVEQTPFFFLPFGGLGR